jgi:AcrR family transcriptional regulator
MRDTRERILDAAERLFGELGYEATSLRTVTAQAGANIAAVNYHFKSKEGLLRAALARRFRPINDQRLTLLDAYEKERGTAAPRVEDLVRILLAPLLVMGSDSGPQAAGLKMFFGRMYAEPTRNIHRVFFQEMKDVVGRFAAAFQRAMPSLPPVEIYWKIHFSIGATAHTLVGATLLETMSGGLCDPHDYQAAVERLIAFVVGGLKAPPLAHVGKGGSRISEPSHVSQGKQNRIRSLPR